MRTTVESLQTALAASYRIERQLGEGGMATVYLAEDLKHARQVAVKVLRPELAASVGADRFLQEIRTTANLRHPNIVPLYDSGSSDGWLFYVMPFVDGESLEQRLERDGQLGMKETLQIAREVADALGYAHERGLLHRDIKPGNIMLERGHAVVTDFGIARAVSTAGGDRLTRTGMAVGTPAYMSPEQASGLDDVDARSDLYSLACVVYEMLAGQPPFTGKTASIVMARHALDPIPPLATARPGIPAHVADAVERALAKTPADRFATTGAWVDAMTTVPATAVPAIGAGTTPTPVESPVTRRPAELGIAVLPLKHAGENHDLAALAGGLSEDIASGLARFSYLAVTEPELEDPSDASRTDPRAIASRLGVRYLLTGALRQSGDLVRLGVRVIDAISGERVWAETYDRDLGAASVFDVQDDLTDRIVATVADSYGVLVRSMARLLQNTPDEQLDPSDWVLRLFGYRQRITPEENAEMREGLERAVRREPQNADAWACLAQIYVDEQSFGFNPSPDTLDRALEAARRAVDIDRSSQLGYQVLAQTHFFRRDLAAFRPAAQRAMELNPRDSNTIGILGLMIVHTGEFERGGGITRRAMALNPHHAGWYHFGPLWEHYHAGEFEKALAHANQVNMPEQFWQHLAIASICGHMGQTTEAAAAIRELLRVDPDFTAHARRNIESWHFASGLLEPLLDGLRKAGLRFPDDAGALGAGVDAGAPTAEAVSEPRPIPSVAVLPFEDMSPEGDQEYFCDGMCEEILNALARVNGLRVASRTSSFGFKGSNADTRTIGARLEVSNLLEGSVRKAGDRLRVTAQLIDVAEDSHLWSETYDRTMQDIFAIQEDMAQSIVKALEVALTPGESAALRGAPTADAEAYDYYLRGRAFFHRGSRQDHEFARQMFQRAIDIDPSFARAHAGLADTNSYIYKHFEHDPALLEEADAASARALALEPRSAEAHASRGTVAWLNERLDEADREFEMAIGLDPSLFEPYFLAGISTFCRGQFEESARLFEAASRVRPDDYQAPLLLGGLYRGLERLDESGAAYERGLEVAREHLQLYPRDVRAWYLGASALVALGQVDQGLEWAERARAMEPENSLVFQNLAGIYAAAGRIEEGVAYIERAVELGFRHRGTLENDPDLAPLREHPRFAAVLDGL